MTPIFRVKDPLPEVTKIGIYSAVIDDADEVRFPVVVDGGYFHFLQTGKGNWQAIGLDTEFCRVVSDAISSNNLLNFYEGAIKTK